MSHRSHPRPVRRLIAKRCFPQTAAQAWPRAYGGNGRALPEITHQRPALVRVRAGSGAPVAPNYGRLIG